MSDNEDYAKKAIGYCQSYRISPCVDFATWSAAGLGLASLGESGRELFHLLASLDSRYDAKDTEQAFTRMLKTTKGFGAFVNLMKAAGVPSPSEMYGTSYKPEYQRPSAKVSAPAEPEKEIPTPAADLVAHTTTYQSSNLYKALIKLLPGMGKVINAVFERYQVRGANKGTRPKDFERYQDQLWRGACAFPHIYPNGLTGAVKIMAYAESGKRVKDANGKGLVTTLHYVAKREPPAPPGGLYLFGAYQLTKEPGRVFIVESEKAALICRILTGEGVWLASGGKGQLSAKKLLPWQKWLSGREIYYIPDGDDQGQTLNDKISAINKALPDRIQLRRSNLRLDGKEGPDDAFLRKYLEAIKRPPEEPWGKFVSEEEEAIRERIDHYRQTFTRFSFPNQIPPEVFWPDWIHDGPSLAKAVWEVIDSLPRNLRNQTGLRSGFLFLEDVLQFTKST